MTWNWWWRGEGESDKGKEGGGEEVNFLAFVCGWICSRYSEEGVFVCPFVLCKRWRGRWNMLDLSNKRTFWILRRRQTPRHLSTALYRATRDDFVLEGIFLHDLCKFDWNSIDFGCWAYTYYDSTSLKSCHVPSSIYKNNFRVAAVCKSGN